MSGARRHLRPGAGTPGRIAAALLAAAAGGCGIADTGPSAAGEPARGARAPDAAPPLRVYYLTQNGTWPAARTAPPRADVQTAVDELLAGPTRAERARGLVTRLPEGRVRAEASAGTADLYLPWVVSELHAVAVSQLVCTAAAAPGIPGGGDPLDVVVQVHESGLPGGPWRVRCDETGSAVPLGSPRGTGGGERGGGEQDEKGDGSAP